MTIATSRNLTVLGIATILGALANLVLVIFDGDPLTQPDWGITMTAIIGGVGNILAKGAATTGGVVDPAGNPVSPTS